MESVRFKLTSHPRVIDFGAYLQAVAMESTYSKGKLTHGHSDSIAPCITWKVTDWIGPNSVWLGY